MLPGILKTELDAYKIFVLTYFPGKLGYRLRYHYYSKRFARCGKHVSFSPSCIIRGEQNITIGDYVGFGLYNYLYAGIEKDDVKIQIGNNVSFNSNVMLNADIGGNIRIGDNVLIGPNVVLRTANHAFSRRDIFIKQQGHTAGPIHIGDDVWIAANVVIVADVTIGNGAIVAAGAVVTKNVDDYSIVAGVPARKIGNR